jgi:hypothetical protein
MFFQRNTPFGAHPGLNSVSTGHFDLLVLVAAVVPLYLIALLLANGSLIRFGKGSHNNLGSPGGLVALVVTLLWLAVAIWLEIGAALGLMGNGASNTMAHWIGIPFLVLTVATLLAILINAWERGAPRQQSDDLKRIADAAEAFTSAREPATPEKPQSEE